MTDHTIQVLLHILVIVFGLHYVGAYIFRRTMYIPGEFLEPGTKPIGRLFVLCLGLVMVIWSGYSLFGKL